MRIFGLAGWSGSGKTTLLTAVIPDLVARGFAVSTIKHAHHAFDIDRPGKDSWRHREAGAREVMVASARRWALMHELRDAAEPTLEELVARMSPVDLLACRGLEAPSPPQDRGVPADRSARSCSTPRIRTSSRLPRTRRSPRRSRCLPLGDAGAVAAFILDHLGLLHGAAER